MKISGIDYLVLTVRDIDNSVAFYTRVPGMQLIEFGENRKALGFGSQKINLHEAGHEFAPRAASATPGSVDLCLLTDMAMTEDIRIKR